MSSEYDVRESGHNENCSYWIGNVDCSCHVYERDLAYANGYRAARSRMAEDFADSISEGYTTAATARKEAEDNHAGFKRGCAWMRVKIAHDISIELENRGCSDRDDHIKRHDTHDCHLCWLARGYERSFDIARGDTDE